jgi:proteasome alpha subunit
MIEEPYRWVEAIANRREYVEHQLAPGSPIVALSYADGILLFTLSRERQKLFEIYDRIGLGGIGHPGDIERLRLAAIELCSTEGFTRSAHDVSLRRLANFSLSPALKAAFEQIYGAPYLARLLFAELGRNGSPNLFVRLEYDGSIHTNGGGFGRAFQDFGVIAGTQLSAGRMERLLRERNVTQAPFAGALRAAAEAWSLGHLTLSDEQDAALPPRETLATHLREQLAQAAIECAVLERAAALPMSWRTISENESRPLLTAET